MKKALFIGSFIGLICGVVAEICFIAGINEDLTILALIGIGLMYIVYPVAGIVYLAFSGGPGQWVYIEYIDPLMKWMAEKFGFLGTEGSLLWCQTGISVIIDWVIYGSVGGLIYRRIKKKRNMHKHGEKLIK